MAERRETWDEFVKRAPSAFDEWIAWGMRNGSDVVQAMALALEPLDVTVKKPKLGAYSGPVGKPTVKVVGGDGDAAHYDRTTHVITVRQGAAEDVAWAAFLFETYNASGREALKDAQSRGKAKSGPAPQAYGRQLADVEFETFVRYMKTLIELEKRFGRPKLPEQARRALTEWEQQYDGKPTDVQQARFAATVHNAGAPNDSTESLPSEDMYAYEAVESWDGFDAVVSRLEAALIGTKQGEETKIAPREFAWKLTAAGSAWPKTAANRPHVYTLVIDDIVRKYETLVATCPKFAAYANLAPAQGRLRRLALSGACQALALRRLVGPAPDVSALLTADALRGYLLPWLKEQHKSYKVPDLTVQEAELQALRFT